jgi:hypothetical protein
MLRFFLNDDILSPFDLPAGLMRATPQTTGPLSPRQTRLENP